MLRNPALRSALRNWRIFRPALALYFGTANSYKFFLRHALKPYVSILKTGEFHNFTYDITPMSMRYLAETIAIALSLPVEQIEAYIQEPLNDEELARHIMECTHSRLRNGAMQNKRTPFGRRLGWYAFARALKPKVVVETGVERGHGSVLICSALLRNAAEGYPGRYYGTDINRHAGWLLCGKYAECGTILYGDSIESLNPSNSSM
jgi:hypothetical protein